VDAMEARPTSEQGPQQRPQQEPQQKPKRNWIQEERRKTLGDFVAFCVQCGYTLRYFLELEDDLPAACPDCTGEMRHRCPACSAPFPSAFQVECEECGTHVRPPELFGGRIRREGR
jgi:DNA-directed RNA polymerase subunit RPC12/RpoP